MHCWLEGDQGPLTNESLRVYDAFSPDGVVVTANHDPIPAKRQTNGAAWCDAAGTPVMHHVTDMPSNVALAAKQVAAIVKADRLAEQRVPSLKPGESLGPDAALTSASGSAQLHNQLDANIVLIDLGKVVWSTGTLDKSCAPQHCQETLELTAEGALRFVARNGTVVWTPPGLAKGGPGATELILQDDCNLVLKRGRVVLWASGSKCAGLAPLSSLPRQQKKEEPFFYFLRNILRTATFMADAAAAIKGLVPAMEFVDPYTMGLLIKCESGAIDCRPRS